MAQCYKCNKQISYVTYFKGIFKFFWKNMWRRTLPVFECPSCGTLCQESAFTTYSYIILSIPLIFLYIHTFSKMGYDLDKDHVLIFVCLVLWIIGHAIWWRFVSTLKEPFPFFWEK